jgi:glycine/D-amino acid oxidase-like deaminating enzyme
VSAEIRVDVAVVGAGIAGIATAYYLSTRHRVASVLLIDSRQAMSFTSAQSGDNYRNWWPHPTMVDFTNDSIELMEELARQTGNIFRMTRRGYALVTRRENIDDLVAELHAGYGSADKGLIRIRSDGANASYEAPESEAWEDAPDGVDVLSNQALIRSVFPSFDNDIEHVVHIRRAGDISGQQLGQYMLEQFRDAGGQTTVGKLCGLELGQHYVLDIETGDGTQIVRADSLVNAAGPFAGEVAAMIDRPLPLDNIFQQKIAFEDTLAAVPRNMPFSIDLDQKRLSWTEEERQLLTEDTDHAWLTEPLPGGTHCRPEGGEHGKWVKLGWAYNAAISPPQDDLANEPKLDAQFPEIVIRGAAGFIPSLAKYIDNPPTRFSHYGGYYTMTEENWPLIGPLDDGGAFVVGALSGFGSMAACAAGSLSASWVCGSELPAYAADLSLSRYENSALVDELRSAANKGLL